MCLLWSVAFGLRGFACHVTTARSFKLWSSQWGHVRKSCFEVQEFPWGFCCHKTWSNCWFMILWSTSWWLKIAQLFWHPDLPWSSRRLTAAVLLKNPEGDRIRQAHAKQQALSNFCYDFPTFSLFHFCWRENALFHTQSWVRSTDYCKLRRRQKNVFYLAIWINMAFEV